MMKPMHTIIYIIPYTIICTVHCKIIRDDISEKLENLEENLQTLEKYPYLFPEIAELCNFWRFRFNALERKQARKYLVRINYYFSKSYVQESIRVSSYKGLRKSISNY